MNVDAALPTFVAESRELLREMETDLLACEHGEADPEVINAIFRAAHTIKGSSGLFGLEAIVEFTHVVEGVLDHIRDRTLDLNRELTALLLECRDHIQLLIDSVAAGGDGRAPLLDVAGASLLERLSVMSGGMVLSPAEVAQSEPPVPAARSSCAKASDAWRAATDCWHISVRFAADVLRNGMDPLSFIRYLTTLGSITGLQLVEEALPPVERFDPEACYLGYEIAFRSGADRQRIEAAFEFVREDCELHILPPGSPVSEYAALIRVLPEEDILLGELLVACGTLTRRELDHGIQAQESLAASQQFQLPAPADVLEHGWHVQPAAVAARADTRSEDSVSKEAKPLHGSLRVDGEKLDQLIDLIGELVTAGRQPAWRHGRPVSRS